MLYLADEVNGLFRQVTLTNEIVGNSRGDVSKGKMYAGLIEEELLNETLPAVKAFEELGGIKTYREMAARTEGELDGPMGRLMHEIRDGLADTLVVISGWLHCHGSTSLFSYDFHIDEAGVDNHYELGHAPQVYGLASWQAWQRNGGENRTSSPFAGSPADMIRFVFDLATHYRIPVLEDWEVVNRANLNKFDMTPEDAALTGEMCINSGLEYEQREYTDGGLTWWATVSPKDQTDKNGKFWKEGKYMKSYAWVEPTFKPLDV